MGVAIFDLGIFLARYPEFTVFNTNNHGSLQTFFDEAGLYLSNCPNSPVQNLTRRLILLNMLTAHIGFIGGALSSDGQARPVGRLDSAGEGSVNAGFDFTPATPGSGPWFNQSQYGAAFWQATASLRSARYFRNPTRF
jgi:hypothetical protein